jgi:hypothetical protein
MYSELIYIQTNNETFVPLPVTTRVQVNVSGITKIYNATDALFIDAKFVSSEENGFYNDTIFPYKTNTTFFTKNDDQDPFILDFLVNNKTVVWATNVSTDHFYSIWLDNLTNPFLISINKPLGISFQTVTGRRRNLPNEYFVNSSISITVSLAAPTNANSESSNSMLIVFSILGAVLGLGLIVYFRHLYKGGSGRRGGWERQRLDKGNL